MPDHASAVARHFDPSSYNSLRAPAAPLRFSPTLEVARQGTCWHGAGLAATARQHQAVALAHAALYPRGVRLTERRVWGAVGSDVVFMEWRSEGELWNGRPVRNGGMTIFEFADDAVQEMRVFTNTAYLEAIETGWSERLPIDVLLALPAYHMLGLPAIEWRPHPPHRGARVAGDPKPAYDGPLTLEQRVARWTFPGERYVDKPAAFRLPVAPDGYTEFQGTRWYLAGRNGEESLSDPSGANPVAIAQRALWTPPGGGGSTSAMSHVMTWAAEDDPGIVLYEWVSDRLTFTGRRFRNHGATVMSFDAEGRRAGHREYCNIAYLEAVNNERDFRAIIGDEAFFGLKASESWDRPSDDWQVMPIPAR